MLEYEFLIPEYELIPDTYPKNLGQGGLLGYFEKYILQPKNYGGTNEGYQWGSDIIKLLKYKFDCFIGNWQRKW